MDTLTLENAYDLHIHGGPDVIDRIGTDIEIARQAEKAGMKGIVLKSTIAPSYIRAWHTQKHVENLRVFGGVVLDYHVGGINPLAVEPCIRMGGKIVWMPTYHAFGHRKIFGHIGDGIPCEKEKMPIRVLDSNGNLTKDTVEVMELCRDSDIILATGHLCPEEIMVMAQKARDMKLRKLVVTHAFWLVPHLDIDQIGELIRLGAYIEFSANEMCPIPGAARLEDYIACMDKYGVNQIFLSSDAGHNRKGWPVEELRIFAQWFAYLGVPVEKIRHMITDTPAMLLNS